MSVELILENKNANVVTVPVVKTMILGRGEECDLRIASNSVSRKHCRLEVKGDKVAIRDLGSSNGTFINDKKLPEKKAVKLVDGMVIKIGPMVAKVSIPNGEAVAETLAAPEPELAHPAELDTAEFDGFIPPEDELDSEEESHAIEQSEEEAAVIEGEGEDTAFFDQEEIAEAIEEEREVDADSVEVESQASEDEQEYDENDETMIDDAEEVEEYEGDEDESGNGMDEFFPEDNFDEDDVFGDGEEEVELEAEEDRVDIVSNDDESLSDFLKGLE